MRLSHSKLSCILNCPMTYYLKYKQGISLKETKKAFVIGSDVHWGIEHSESNLQEHYIEEGTYHKDEQYSREQVLAEVMVQNYLNHKDELFNKILTDYDTGEKLELLEEIHEIFLTGYLKSYTNEQPHEFIGIIDLLLLTNKGFIIIDYKTSSAEPDWNNYLDQIYRYILLIKSEYPDVPIYKIGIINLIKSKLTWRNGESQNSFTKRLTHEYNVDDDYINYHEFKPELLDNNKISDYIENLSHMADLADSIDRNSIYFINFDNAISKYGKSEYYDIFYKTSYAYLLYKISDEIYDESTNSILTERDCIEIDMKVIESNNVLNKYSKFRDAIADFKFKTHCSKLDKSQFFSFLKTSFEYTNDDLLEKYWLTYIHYNS